LGTPLPGRVILLVLDSVGVGALPDADQYGDAGSDTLGHVDSFAPLAVPHLRSLGLARVSTIAGRDPEPAPIGACGRMAEASPGKDSVTGHWELMGLVLERPFPVFPNGFPAAVIEAFERRIGRGVLANRPASGTVIIDELGAEHLRTGKPIVYTSADSVFRDGRGAGDRAALCRHAGPVPADRQPSRFRPDAVCPDAARSPDRGGTPRRRDRQD